MLLLWIIIGCLLKLFSGTEGLQISTACKRGGRVTSKVLRKGLRIAVLHDVDQVPEKKENNYSWKEKPTLLLSATSQWNYKRKNPDVVGGALQISHVDYAVVGGYSNVFEGWGREDDNMAYRLKKHMGYDVLASSIGRYTELTHQRVWGLDETEQFRRNNANVHDLSNGVDRVQFAIKKWDNTSCSDTMIYRAWVQTMPNKSVQ